ncbi:hypothetical protein EJB05_17442, partial [Eragrostis curvula]
MVATRSKTAPPRPRPAFFSHPSEEELIGAFLRPRVSGGNKSPSPSAFIHDADVYSASPDVLTNDFAPAVASNGDRAWYFFSPVRTKSREGQRKARTVDNGDGCWHSEAGAKPVVVEHGRRLGHRQSFSFVTKVDGRRVRSGWLMVELGLDDADETVLCKIYFSPRAHLTAGAAASSSAARKRKAAAAANDDDDRRPAPVRRRRASPPTDSAAPHAEDTSGAEEKDDTEQEDGWRVYKSINLIADPDDDNSGDSLLTQIMRNREMFREMGIVDRPDEEIQADNGLTEFVTLLNGMGKNFDQLRVSPSTYEDRGYPACLSREDLNSAYPLWFERPVVVNFGNRTACRKGKIGSRNRLQTGDVPKDCICRK